MKKKEKKKLSLFFLKNHYFNGYIKQPYLQFFMSKTSGFHECSEDITLLMKLCALKALRTKYRFIWNM